MIVGINLIIDGKDYNISIDEARVLHGELGKLFSNQPIVNSRSTSIPEVAKTNIPKEVTKPTQKVDEKPDVYSNPIVEAAKKRAAKRTSGCGSRR